MRYIRAYDMNIKILISEDNFGWILNLLSVCSTGNLFIRQNNYFLVSFELNIKFKQLFKPVCYQLVAIFVL